MKSTLFGKALQLYDSDVVKRRVRTSFTAMKNRALQRFGYDLQIEDEPFRSYYGAVVHLIEVANAVKGAAMHLQSSIEEDKKASSLLREAMEAVAASDDQFTFGVDVHADSVSGSWDSSLEHSLDELLRTIDARVTHFTELRKRLQEREVRRSEYTMEAQNLENMHMRNMPVEATSKVEQKVAEMSRAIAQLNGSIVVEMSDLYKERFQIMAQFLQELEKCQRRFHGAAARSLEAAIADADKAAIATDDAPSSEETARAADAADAADVADAEAAADGADAGAASAAADGDGDLGVGPAYGGGQEEDAGDAGYGGDEVEAEAGSEVVDDPSSGVVEGDDDPGRV